MGRTAILAVRITGDAKGAKQAFDETASAADKFKSGLDKVTPAATVAFAGVVAGAAKAVSAASDLQQALGAVRQVFGSSSGEIERFGQSAAKNLGLSQSAFSQLAAVSGAMLQNLGFSAGEAAKQTETLATRAADLASVFGGSTQEAMDAMNAALRGEFDSLEKYGIKLSQTAVDQQVLAMGLDTSTQAAKTHAQAQAALALIMDQSAASAGNFKAETDTMAGGTQILSAKVEDLWAKLGQSLLPVMQTIVGWLSQFADWASQNSTLLTVLAGVVGTLSGAVLAINAALKAWTAIQLLLNIALEANPIGLIITAIAALVAGIIYAYNNSETFRGYVQRLWQALQQAWQVIQQVAQAVGQFFVNAWHSAGNAINSVIATVRNVIDWIQRAIAAVRSFFSSGINNVGNAIGGLFRTATVRVAPDGSTFRAAPAGTTRASTMGGGTVVLNNMAWNPHSAAHDLQRILTGAQVRTGYSGIRA